MKLVAALIAVIGLSGCIAVPVYPHRHVYAAPPPRAVIVAPHHREDWRNRDDRQRWRDR